MSIFFNKQTIYKNISVLMLLFCGVLLLGCKESGAENEAMDEIKASKVEKCEGEIIVELGPYHMKLPRKDGILLTTENNESITNLHEAHYGTPCEKKFFDGIHKIRILDTVLPFDTGHFTFFYKEEEDVETDYSNMTTRERSDSQQNKPQRQRLDNGIIRIEQEGYAVNYVLPTDVAQTKSGKPIIFGCSRAFLTRNCHTSYVLPNDLYLAYRANNDPDKLIELENQARKYVLDLIVKRNESVSQKDVPIDIPPPTEEQKRNLEAMMEREKYRDLPDCEGEATVLIGPYIFIVPRKNGIHLNRTDAETPYDEYRSIHRPQPDADCEREFFDNVSGISMTRWATPELIGQLHFGYHPDPELIDSYDSAMKAIEKFKMTKTVLDNGIEYYESEGHLVFYILPKDAAPTINEKPVTIDCPKVPSRIGGCDTRYILPNGLSVFYKFKMTHDLKDNPDKFFEIEKTAREFVLGMIHEDLSEKNTEETP